jgi:hypothetical protein
MAIVMSTGGPASLQDIMNLVRVYLKDWQQSGAGIITTDDAATSPQTLPALMSSIRWVYRKLRNVGDPRLIRDNVQVAIPANGLTGPSVQTYLTYNGYFDGLALNATPALPADLLYPIELWEQQTGSVSNLPFVRMTQPQFGLQSRNQTFALCDWEWREQPTTNSGLTPTPGTINAPAGIFFVGVLAPVTVRIRYMATLVSFVSLTSADYANAYVPIIDAEEAIAYRCAYIIGAALSGITPGVTMLKEESESAMQDLRNSVVRRQQTVEYARQPYDAQVSGIWGSYNGSTNLI